MARKEFSAKVRDQAFAKSGNVCGVCKLPLVVGKFAYDHILPDALGGKPELANCMVICTPCHAEKTGKQDVPRIRKADRQRRAHIGAKVEPAKKIESAGFPAKAKREPKPSLPPRPMFY
jgi:5-methylcytosine-specific restriction protein A